MSQKLKIIFFLALATTAILSLAIPALAEESWLSAIIPGGRLIPEACTESPARDVNACGTTQMFQTLVNFSRLILALSGSAALLMFTFGGVMFIIAAGNQEQVQKGKAAMTAAAIGLIIILCAWLIINTTICVLTQGTVGCDKATIFGLPWFQEIPAGGS